MFNWLPQPIVWTIIAAGLFGAMGMVIWWLWNYRPPWDKDNPKIDHPGK